ncbi:DUF6580 family putative transport protein [Flavihumibacter fluvii]|uniref:DUF6580 family putative transport protein n=1 Tax=Flavihumibacter fluvii TaxID=2838157 RepID=UPI001BDE7E6E|nr:DUF6580 family putative transport protein [Flavihumibacter fluvii]ULQ53128.1 hypothetical protein KJS93_02200 [Flavihumibacter fluvii]
MKFNRSIFISLVLLIVVAAIYRIVPARPFGLISFAPHIAMALFGGAVIKDRKWAFALPIFSMFLSDVLFQVLYVNGLSSTPGFYAGQITNYVLFAGLTLVGFAIKRITIPAVLTASLVAPTLYFIFSNFFVWTAGAGFERPKTLEGLLACYADGLPFYTSSIAATLMFSTILFGGYYLLTERKKVEAV